MRESSATKSDATTTQAFVTLIGKDKKPEPHMR